jgi:hypothetical protein
LGREKTAKGQDVGGIGGEFKKEEMMIVCMAKVSLKLPALNDYLLTRNMTDDEERTPNGHQQVRKDCGQEHLK